MSAKGRMAVLEVSENQLLPVGRQNALVVSVESYDDIREHLARKLLEAFVRYKNDRGNPEAAEAMEHAREEYDNFTLHGLIPNDMSE